MYDQLEGNDDDLIDFDQVTEYAMSGVKNPKMIAHLMGVPVELFDDEKERVELAIERGLANLVMATVGQLRLSAAKGDFQAQKYLLQNIDDSWADKREVKNTSEFDPLALPGLMGIYKIGIEEGKKLKHEKSINGSYKDEGFEEC